MRQEWLIHPFSTARFPHYRVVEVLGGWHGYLSRRNELQTRKCNHSVSGILFSIRKLLLMLGPVLLATTGPTIAQNGELQQKLAAVKQAAAANQQQLRQYQWTETTQVTLKGDAKPSSQKLCQYGPDGQVQKTPIGAPPEE
jgi:hypothetical protein